MSAYTTTIKKHDTGCISCAWTPPDGASHEHSIVLARDHTVATGHTTEVKQSAVCRIVAAGEVRRVMARTA